MRPRTIALVGATIVAAGLIVQQLVIAAASSASWSGGAQLDQSMLGALLTVGGLVATVAVPLGSAVLGGGLVLHLASRPRSADPSMPIEGAHEAKPVAPSADAR